MSYQTDKTIHGLIAEYEKIFGPIKDKALNILEVGIYQGGSLQWMLEYFPNAHIVGADIVLPVMDEDPRLTMYQMDQRDSLSIARMIKNEPEFDIIIDDGCHYMAETKNTFDNLWPRLVSGGLYIIEDFIAGYWPDHRFTGMPELVAKIMCDKNALHISDYNIILKEPKCSIACFKKI